MNHLQRIANHGMVLKLLALCLLQIIGVVPALVSTINCSTNECTLDASPKLSIVDAKNYTTMPPKRNIYSIFQLEYSNNYYSNEVKEGTKSCICIPLTKYNDIFIHWLTHSGIFLPKLDHTRSNLRSRLLRNSNRSDHLWMQSTVITIGAWCVEDEIKSSTW
jgi:hypothetical protein